MDNQDIICSEKCNVKIAYNHEAFNLNSKQISHKNSKQMKQPSQDIYIYIYISLFMYAMQCLAPLSFLISPGTKC